MLKRNVTLDVFLGDLPRTVIRRECNNVTQLYGRASTEHKLCLFGVGVKILLYVEE